MVVGLEGEEALHFVNLPHLLLFFFGSNHSIPVNARILLCKSYLGFVLSYFPMFICMCFQFIIALPAVLGFKVNSNFRGRLPTSYWVSAYWQEIYFHLPYLVMSLAMKIDCW